MADKKISELTQITGANVDDTNDEIAIVDASASETKAITRGELFSDVASGSFDGDVTVGGNLTVNGTTVTIDTTTLDVADKNITIAKDAPDAATADGAGLTVDGANATITYDSTDDTWDFNKGVSTTGDIEVTGTVDGRDVAADGSKLDGIESGATADQTAGEIKTAYESNADTNAFTDAEQSKLTGIEAGATADQTAGEIKTAYESNADTNAFTDAEQSKLSGIESGAEVNTVDSVNTQTGTVVLDADDIDDSTTTNKFTTAADKSKLDGIETNADVTDTANVTAAGALMDSELTSEASVKALDQGVATTDSPEFAGLTVDTDTLYVDSANNRVGIGTSSPDEALTIQEGAVKTRLDLDFTEDHHVFSNSHGTRYAGIGLLTSSADLYIEDDTGDSITFDRSANELKFGTNASEAMRITSTGIVDILSGTVELNGNELNSIQVTIADDAVAELTFPGRNGGCLFLSASNNITFPQLQYGYAGFIDFGSSPGRQTAMFQGGGCEYNDSSALTGTTGTDGKVTVGTAGTSGTLYIENRSGVSRVFQITLI